jgi:general secretion pathway protein E
LAEASLSPLNGVSEFLNYLVSQNVITSEARLRYTAAARASRLQFDEILLELGLLRDADLVRWLNRYFSREPLPLPVSDETQELVAALGWEFCFEHAIMPIGTGADSTLAVANPFDCASLDLVAYFFDRPLLLEAHTRVEIRAALNTMQTSRPTFPGETTPDDIDLLENDAERLRDIALDAPVVSLVTRVAQKAFELGASDIHLEPLEDRLNIRFRRDGMLSLEETASRALHTGVVTRIKILSRLDIVERRRPQDGRMRLSIRGEEVDFRVSVMPSVHGETIVMRLLVGSNANSDLASLGYDEEAAQTLRRLASAANGIVVMTGPTGSGKTTTLYSLVRQLDRAHVKIFTIEDPVEYRMEGITQLQIDNAIGLDFPTALRSVLRQDPDVILVGEIRDRETAQIAIQAALTGHLVLTTLHTNSAAGALTRMRDMGIEPFLIGATMRGVVAQRLARQSCQACRSTQDPSCSACGGTATFGRTVVYEILQVTQGIGKLINEGADERELASLAIKEGMRPMSDCGARLVENGRVTDKEIARVLSVGGEHG